jgi:crossover junction endodeoxyribonuclease RuvC
MSFIVGCDPGLNGAIAVLTKDGEFVKVFDTPTYEVTSGKKTVRRVLAPAIVAELEQYTNAQAFIEMVGSRPGEGHMNSFNFGKSAGILEGIMAGLRIPSQTVSSMAWTRQMRVGKEKDQARAIVAQTWPIAAAEVSRKKDIGRADALLIAEYGRLTCAR